MGTETSGLREQKKRQTRQAISHVATRLFIERGFDAVTIAEVASAAGVAKMTVTNHFPRKEDLVLDLHEELVAGPARAVAERAPGESAAAAIRQFYFEALAGRDAALGFSGEPFARLITESPVLRARLREIHEEREDALAAVLLAEDPEHGGTARMVAATLVTVCRVLLDEVFGRTLAGESNEEIAAALVPVAEHAFGLVEQGIGDVAPRAV
ncbi:TetR/AcrR family transcriptional regulator [Solihabitans fulvus]|uniref:TetR/AcrR family transcriptional regulator n=1 Tax=Solihabitans fulvus TaxID=1892852 RepID=A0A5B2XIN8_9PSEU|nr:TetR/AcrR family transcriptional regulator [Solihabitans fulvus]KAA2263728.1 TetR/AcrR family transcriptional regulator [Solihabitans fulvus]